MRGHTRLDPQLGSTELSLGGFTQPQPDPHIRLLAPSRAELRAPPGTRNLHRPAQRQGPSSSAPGSPPP